MWTGGNAKGERTDIPADASGERYSHVFGTNTSGFELFVIDRKIMGPCWLNIPAPRISTKAVSPSSCATWSPTDLSLADLLDEARGRSRAR